MMRAPEIDGEAYWDGGFMGNPAIFPVIYGCEARDVVIIHLTPTERSELPTNSGTIINGMRRSASIHRSCGKCGRLLS